MMLSHKKDIGHWEFHRDFDNEEYFGFIYCVKNKVTNQYYIGKKQFFRLGLKKSKTYGKEMLWRNYTGSSVTLNKDIKKLGKKNFSFEIIDLYKTKGVLYYAEAYVQMSLDVMTRRLPDGKTPQFYNRQIAAIRFVPAHGPTELTLSFIERLKGELNGKNRKKKPTV
jgi:hypothetical protein